MLTPLTTSTVTLKAGSEAVISGCQCEYEGGASRSPCGQGCDPRRGSATGDCCVASATAGGRARGRVASTVGSIPSG